MKKIILHRVCGVALSVLVAVSAVSAAWAEDTAPVAGSNTNILRLVNKTHLLEEEFVPDDLVELSGLLPCSKRSIKLSAEPAEQLQKLFADMPEEIAKDFACVSGYRSYETQRQLNRNQIARYSDQSEEEAIRLASQVVAPPGASEHQTGLAIDVSDRSVGYQCEADFADTENHAWLLENAWKYGFIIRYTAEKTAITDIIDEPWHLRYVGADAARVMTEQGLCFEEYIEANRSGPPARTPKKLFFWNWQQ